MPKGSELTTKTSLDNADYVVLHDSDEALPTNSLKKILAKDLLEAFGVITQQEFSTDPDDPAEGHNVTWQSDGTGSGDDGDIMIKITAGSVTKTKTIVDYSV